MQFFFLYIDPGSGSMLIQMLIGVGVAVGVFFKRIKYFILYIFKRKRSSDNWIHF